MRVIKAKDSVVETLVADNFECWQYWDCVFIEVAGLAHKLTRPEARKLVKFIQKGDKKRAKDD